MTFTTNKDIKGKFIVHVDGDKSNNCIDNLQIVFKEENTITINGKKVNQIDLISGNIINTFPSISAVSRFLNIKDRRKIDKVLAGKTDSEYGYKWEFY